VETSAREVALPRQVNLMQKIDEHLGNITDSATVEVTLLLRSAKRNQEWKMLKYMLDFDFLTSLDSSAMVRETINQHHSAQ
jgi:hypothetical protein